MICPECKGARFFATTGVIEACTWCGARGHTCHPAQVQEARRLLVNAVWMFTEMWWRLYDNIDDAAEFRALRDYTDAADRECNRAAAVLGLRWEEKR